uniref:hypothetical protein n=1 Tax=Mesomycoplasma hyorhinis TaxID=2100 RepID=UPI001C05A5B7
KEGRVRKEKGRRDSVGVDEKSIQERGGVVDFFFQAGGGIREHGRVGGLGGVLKREVDISH